MLRCMLFSSSIGSARDVLTAFSADPMMKVLAPGWEKYVLDPQTMARTKRLPKSLRAFSRRAPAVTASFARNAATLIKDFHREIEMRARHNGANIAGLHMLQQQLRVYEEIFKDLANTVRETINTQQKDINREFIPVITAAMEPAYNACVEENGRYFPRNESPHLLLTNGIKNRSR